jgi:hypothetical protein
VLTGRAAIGEDADMPYGSIRGNLESPMPGLPPGDACLRARGAMTDAMDLLLIHNERPVSGDQPRAVLNPLVVVLAVSAWERLVVELGAAVGLPFDERDSPGRLKSGKLAKPTIKVLRQATASAAAERRLPEALTVTFYDRADGRRLNRPSEIAAADAFDELAERFDHYVELRHGGAHRLVPQKMTLSVDGLRSDAASSPDTGFVGLTINTSIARIVLAAYLQLVDQTIACVLESAGTGGEDAKACRLPAWWFSDDRESSGTRTSTPGCLWGGTRLPRRL